MCLRATVAYTNDMMCVRCLQYASDERDFFRGRLDERMLKYSANAPIPDTKLSR